MWAHQRTLRLADGPDEVHKRTIATHELRRWSAEPVALINGAATIPAARVGAS
jgi:acyl-CoA dehydrogenase